VFVFKGHSDAITALRWGEGGRSVFSAAKDKTIRIWDTRAGRQRVALEKHFGAVTALRAIPEALQCNAIKSGVGAAFMSGGRDAMVNLWTSTGDCVGTQAAHRGQVVSLSDINCGLNYRGLSGQPLLFSLGADSMLKLWELRRFRAVAEIPLGQQCTKGVWAGQSIVTSGPTGTVTCWNYSGAASAAAAATAAASMGASSDESSSSSSGWKGRDLSCHSAACTDLISTESVVASAAKNGQVLVWGGAGV
jgi:WD40 repeat protein